ncbi:MAG: hypothetical protein RLZZ600_141 [Actinomycetota bacterium]
MRAGAAFIAGAGSAAIVAIGWAAGTGALAGSNTNTASNSSSNSSSTATATTAAGITGTFHGNDVADDGGYGDVQVDVVFENGKITDIVTVSCNATDGRDQACPMMREQAISAQSANISTIGRATFTSLAYISSLQSALDAAGFKG